jgi:uncharacterized damage-inducible protein DinB
MDSTTPAPTPAGTLAEQAVAELRRERAATLHALSQLTDQQLATRIDWRGSPQAVNARVMAFGTHMIDHQQHLLRLLYARGRGLTAAEYLMVKNAALTAELETMALVLDDADFTAQGPVEGDWSAEEILQHVIRSEKGYRERILAGLEAARAEAARAEASGDGAGA